ncbi:MAG: SNF2-related protein [Oscillospiraceae bacterium]|nr:SNF2-related protein [Oscillospiraceae bacterium]
MSTKLNHYTELLSNSVNKLSDTEKWQNFLATASRLYKYKFRDQVMIHAQRPNATACAGFDLWKRPDLADRHVKRGSKGIALLDDSGARTNLRYVFDYADTESQSQKKLFLWKITDENEGFVSKMLEQRYGVEGELSTALLDTAKRLTERLGGDFANELIDYTEGTFLEELDDYNVWVQFSEVLENSIAYTLLSRCGFAPNEYFGKDDFQNLHNFNSVETLTILGRAMSDLSETALRDIERTVKSFERSKRIERNIAGKNHGEISGRHENDVSVGRGNADLFTAKSDNYGATDNRILRADEGELSERNEADGIRNHANQGDVAEPLDGNRANSEGLRNYVTDGNGEVGRRGREIEIGQSNALGAENEPAETTGKGNRSERNNPQLTAENGGFLTPETLDIILKNDTNMNVKKPEILEYFLEHDSPKNRANFIKAAYNMDFTLVEIGEDKLLYSYQKTADNLDVFLGGAKVRIPWHDVQTQVANLIAKHEYLDENPIDIAGISESAFFAAEPPKSQQLSLFGEEINVPEKPVKSAHSAEDEAIIKSELMRGSNFEDSKFRIEKYAKSNPTTAEFAKFLSKEYGIGGHSGDGIVKSSDHNGKGIHLRLYDENSPNGERKISLNWNQTAKRIAELVKSGEYITEDDISRRIRHAEYVLNNYAPADDYNLRRIEEAEKVLELYGMFEDNEELEIRNEELNDTPKPDKTEVSETHEMPETSELDEDDYPDYLVTEGDILELDDGIYEVVRICDGELKLKETTTEEIVSMNEDELYNHGFAVVEKAVLDDDLFDISVDEVAAKPHFDEIDPTTLIGKHYVIDGREMIVEKVDTEWDKVSFLDVALMHSYPISRSENIEFLLNIERAEREKSELATSEIDITDLAVEDEPEIIITPLFPHLSKPNEVQESPKSKGENFRITDDNLGVGGAKEKFKNNIAAIKLLQEIERAFDFHQSISCPAGTRPPYPNDEEKEALSRYVGWGGLSQAFDEKNPQWANEYKTLKNTLSDYEYECAKESVLNAHYTSPMVIKAIYEGLENLGFKSGNVLEPSVGVGNFFGMIPEEIAKNSKLYGVELDNVSGRIAKQLYPQSDISISGFEDKQFSDNFFDVAVGNVPFGGYKISDKRYDKLNLNIHDYFFAKSLDKVRPGGVVAFITSKGTLDKQNSNFRKYLAERADLLGAIRLPNTAFKANAGTEVTSDIIFLQKRETVMETEPEWVKIGKTNNGISVNKYFIDNPQMMLGTMSNDSGIRLYGGENSTTCVPFEGANLAEQLKSAIANIQGNIPEYQHENESIIDSIPADENVRNFNYTVAENQLYYRENSRMNRVQMPKMTEDRVRAMVGLRDCVRKLIDLQLNEYQDSDIVSQQVKLNNLYDNFNRRYGLINSTANAGAFRDDSSYYLLCSLEILDEQGKLERKADMFTKRTIKQRKIVTSVDTASEALAVSIAEKAGVDLDFMSELSSLPKERLIKDLKDVIYQIPSTFNSSLLTLNYVTADEYLSGNIREKLETARHFNENKGGFEGNIKALEQVMPKPLEACDIDVRLGSTWIEPDTIKDFVFETLKTSYYAKSAIKIHYSKYTSEWNISGKNGDPRNVFATTTFGTSRKNAYHIIEDTLNLRSSKVYDKVVGSDGNEKSVLNKKETMLAQEKQENIKQSFKDWIFKDPRRREHYVEKYNELFNSSRPREYDGSHINFVGMNPEITMQTHQRNAVAHALYGGNTLFAHEVGAGKTYEICASVMESKRLGICNKSLIVVPNHITEQFGGEFLRLYPAANILVATKKDFEKKNRRRLCAKIATGDYDAVIIGHSQLEKIPISQERQQRLMKKQIFEITQGIKEMKLQKGDNFTIKQLEKTKKNLEAKLKKLIESPRRDDVVNFEELGIDKLVVDESHYFKNLFLYTKMRNVAGVQQTEAQKSTDLYLKTQYLDELTGGKGTIFSTGTPLSNSMTELYTVMRYLQSGLLNQKGLSHFDAWAATFGETQTSFELAPEGNSYRSRTRFSRFFNLPELMNMFKECADIKTAETLNLPTPEVEFETVVVEPTEHQKRMIADLSERAKLVRDKKVDPSEDNMLRITGDGRKIGLDQRMINPLLPDEPGTKVNVCVDNVFGIWNDTKSDKSTQLLFCDFSTPNKDGRFNVYDDIRDKLVSRGVPKHEIAFIHEADSEEKKKELFAKVRKGQVRVLLGSTAKMGSGTNVQNRLIALHDLDAPWRPSDMTQRLGRIKRQGNRNAKVKVFRYCTDKSFDSYLYQMLEYKQNFISQIMTSKSPVRSCDDVDEATLSYAEIKALCAGNPLIKEKIDLDVSVAKLKALKSNHVNEQYRLEDNILRYFPEAICRTENRIKGFKSDYEHLKNIAIPADKKMLPMTITGANFTDKEAAGKALIEACKQLKSATQTLDIGEYKGFSMALSFDSFENVYRLELKREMSHKVTLGVDPFGNMTRIDNALSGIVQYLESSESQLETLKNQLADAKSELGKPFPREAVLQEKLARLNELNAILTVEGKDGIEVTASTKAAENSPNVAADSLLINLKIKDKLLLYKDRSQKCETTKTKTIKVELE